MTGCVWLINIYLGSLYILTEEKWKIETSKLYITVLLQKHRSRRAIFTNYTEFLYYRSNVHAGVQMSFVTYCNSFTFIDNLSRLSFIHGEKAEYELLATLSKVISFHLRYIEFISIGCFEAGKFKRPNLQLLFKFHKWL